MRIFLAGHRGMVGAAILRQLQQRSGVKILIKNRDQLDLLDRGAVQSAFAEMRPDLVILAAAKVGGIAANNALPAEFILQNMMIASHVIDAAHHAGVEKLLQFGSSCIYPRDAAQPLAEEALLTGPLEPTNEPYAIAKIAAIKLCESYNRQYGRDYRSVMPTNLYGPGDHYHPEHSHVLPALLRRFHEAVLSNAPEVVIWGSGAPLREFMHVDDLARAALFVLDLPRDSLAKVTTPMQSHINIGSGHEISIQDLAMLIAKITGYQGRVIFDPSRPDGTPRKKLDCRRLSALGWQASIPLEEGIKATYATYQAERAAGLLRGAPTT